MITLNTYLTFEGNCEEAFNFYQTVFGGEFSDVERFENLPEEEGMPPMSNEDKQKIMHMALPIGSNSILMGSDTTSNYGGPITLGNNFSISINTEDETEAQKVFSHLAEGGKITMPMEKTFWNAYFGMLTDKFGINWMVNCQL